MKNLHPFVSFHTPDAAHVDAKEARLKQEHFQKIVAGELPADAPFEFDREAEENRLIVEVMVLKDDGSRQQETFDVEALLPDDYAQFSVLYRKLVSTIAST